MVHTLLLPAKGREDLIDQLNQALLLDEQAGEPLPEAEYVISIRTKVKNLENRAKQRSRATWIAPDGSPVNIMVQPGDTSKTAKITLAMQAGGEKEGYVCVYADVPEEMARTMAHRILDIE